MSDLFVWLLLIVTLAAPYGAWALYQSWLSKSRPDDIPLIKAKLEANEHRVVDIQRAGFVAGTLGRSGGSPAYRKYRVVVRSPLGGPDEVRVMAVSAGLFAFRAALEWGAKVPHNDFQGLS
jgi:hypothetical protein